MYQIRRANVEDVDNICSLFYSTVLTINKKDYTPSQIEVWVEAGLDIDKWKNKINEQHFLIAEERRNLLGFGSLNNEGYLDLLYVNNNFNNRGIASDLLLLLELYAKQNCITRIWAEVSITARPFFLKKGFTISQIHIKKIKGIEFENTLMVKHFS